MFVLEVPGIVFKYPASSISSQSLKISELG